MKCLEACYFILLWCIAFPALAAEKFPCESVIYATGDQFKLRQTPGRNTILYELASLPEAQNVVQPFSLPLLKIAPWILRTITPMDMGPCEFQYHDITVYGRESYFDFARAVFRSLDPLTVKKEYEKYHPPETDKFSDPTEFPNLAVLTAANSWILENDRFPHLREHRGKIKQHFNMWDGAITEQEARILQNSELNGILEVKYETRENYSHQTVTGYFIYYALPEKLNPPSGKGLLDQWEEDAQNALTLQNTYDYQTEIAMLFRRCIANHVFLDGNGRSCHIWAFHALARKNIPFPLIWANEDITLEAQEWVKRWNEGIRLHRRYLQTFED